MARNVPSGTTVATAERATTPAPAPQPATATLPKPTTAAPPKPAATAAPKPATPPKAAAPKPPPARPEEPKSSLPAEYQTIVSRNIFDSSAAPARPAAQSPGAPLTAAYAQSYPEGMSAADYSYEDLGQSESTDSWDPGTTQVSIYEGTPAYSSFYRERMPGPGKPVVQPTPTGTTSPAQYGMPARTVYPGPAKPLEGSEATKFWYGPSSFQSVAQFRDYALGLGTALNAAEIEADAAGRRLEAAAGQDTTTRYRMQQLYDDQLQKLRDVVTLRERLRRVGISDADVETVREHAAKLPE